MAEFVTFRPGVRVSVTESGGRPSFSYQAVIREVSDRGIRLDWPRHNRNVMDVEAGDELTLVLQLHGRTYSCTSNVLDVQHVPSEAITVEHPIEVRHNERRQFYRLLTAITPRYAARTNADGDEVQRLDAKIMDISGGGIQLRCDERVPIGARVRLVFMLEGDPLQLDVTVLALAIQEPDPRRAFYRVNAKFIDVDRDVQERIVRFIFRQQMLLRQRQVI